MEKCCASTDAASRDYTRKLKRPARFIYAPSYYRERLDGLVRFVSRAKLNSTSATTLVTLDDSGEKLEAPLEICCRESWIHREDAEAPVEFTQRGKERKNWFSVHDTQLGFEPILSSHLFTLPASRRVKGKLIYCRATALWPRVDRFSERRQCLNGRARPRRGDTV